MKKYELTNVTKTVNEKTLHRIRALKDFSDVKKGDLGGWIEKESNLSQDGNAWVYKEACVHGNAKIFDNARIYGKAIISGKAHIFGNAEVTDNAIVSNNAYISDKAMIYDNVKISGEARVYGNAKISGEARVYSKASVYGNAEVCGDACVYGNANISDKHIVGKVSLLYKDIFQHQCKNGVLTAILTKNDKILYTIGCQKNITEEEFLFRIHNTDGGLEANPHRKEYLNLIECIKIYFKKKERDKHYENY